MTVPEPIWQSDHDVADLALRHPVRFDEPRKAAVYAAAVPNPSALTGTVRVTRWRARGVTTVLDARRATELLAVRAGFFDYAESGANQVSMAWHVNFADPRLFVAYAGMLFAQDEMQVLEHPVLASVRGVLADVRHDRTVDSAGPSPVLIAGAPRACAIDTGPSLLAPRGIYGNRFSTAKLEAVLAATRVLEPPTPSNILAIAAPAGGRGPYTAQTILWILGTAYAGFRAAVMESGARPVTVVSGFWGCGAFGGNRVLMCVLQALAAQAAGVQRLVLHHGDASGEQTMAECREVLDELSGESGTEAVVEALVGHGFQWGVSDGN